jgi:hypothetical protein
MTERPLDGVYETIRDVEQDPIGALTAIQQLAGETDVLRADVARLRAALQVAVGQKVFVVHDGVASPYETDASRVARAALAHGEADQ